MSTKASSRSNSDSMSELAQDQASLVCVACLRVKNTFLEFPAHLLEPDLPSLHRRAMSAPGRISAGSTFSSALKPGTLMPSSQGEEDAGAAAANGVDRSAGAILSTENRSELFAMLDEFELGSAELPTVGSRDHYLGQCKPCAFVHKRGCANGTRCRFCHICGPEIKRKRQLERLDAKRRFWRQKAKMAAREHMAGGARSS